MSFPQTRLENFTEILIDGVWTDITSSVRAASKIAISRGIRDESTNRAFAGSMQLTIDNRLGTFSDLNPASVYYGKIGRNTRIRHSRKHAYDQFGRTVSNGWGTADSGQSWSTNGGLASDYSVGSGVGSISNGSVNVIRETFMSAGVGGTTLLDGTISATLRPGVVATGAAIQMSLELRRADASNYYFAVVSFNTDSTVNLSIVSRVGGVNTVIGLIQSTLGQLTYTAASAIRLEFTVDGGVLTARIWDVAAPTAYVMSAADGTGVLTAAGSVGCRCALVTSNTNTTPVVTFDDLVVQDIRFSGEVPEWPQRWDMSGRNVYAPLSAAGPLRRLTQGVKRLQSVMTRVISSEKPVAHWPCEDASGATQAANMVVGGQPFKSRNTVPTFGSSLSTVAGSASGVTLASDTGFFAPIPSNTTTTWALELVANVPASPSANSRIIQLDMSGGTYSLIAFTVLPAGGLDTIGLEFIDASGVRGVLYDTAFSFDGSTEAYAKDIFIAVDLRQNGGNVEYQFTVWNPVTGTGFGSGAAGSFAGTLGKVAGVGILPGPAPGAGSGWKYSQISLWDRPTPNVAWFTAAPPTQHSVLLGGYAGEDPVTRLRRLCTENGVGLVVQGTSSTRGVGMGAQTVDILYNLLMECADVDQGLLYETRTDFSLTYRAARSLYHQTPVALNYTGRQLAGDIQPTSDDQYVHNDVTVARKNGSSSRIVDTTSRLSVNEPPSGVGQYDRGTTTVNCKLDSDTRLIAGWLAKLGTVDEPRYPSLAVQMASPAVAANSSLMQALAGLDTGDTFSVSNPPAWLPPFDILQLVLGYQEQMGVFEWTLRWTGRPGKPFDIAIVDGSGNTARVDTGNSTLASSATSSATSFSVATSTGPLLRTGAVSIDLDVAGEKVTATNITGASSPQTVTVTRSVNGIVKAQAAGAVVKLWRPSKIGY